MYSYNRRNKVAGFEGSIHARIRDFGDEVAQKVRAKLPADWDVESVKAGRGDLALVVMRAGDAGSSREGVMVTGHIVESNLILEVASMYTRERRNLKMDITTSPEALADLVFDSWVDAKNKSGL